MICALVRTEPSQPQEPSVPSEEVIHSKPPLVTRLPTSRRELASEYDREDSGK